MNKRVATVLLAIFGLAAAAGIGLAANEVTGDSVGLSADPLEAGDTLAPPAGGRGEPLRSRERTSDSQRGAAGQDPPATAPQPAPVTPTPAPTPEPFDDNGGDRSGSDDSSGPGSGSDDSSGPGSGSDDD
jgi:hypothetical protein